MRVHFGPVICSAIVLFSGHNIFAKSKTICVHTWKVARGVRSAHTTLQLFICIINKTFVTQYFSIRCRLFFGIKYKHTSDRIFASASYILRRTRMLHSRTPNTNHVEHQNILPFLDLDVVKRLERYSSLLRINTTEWDRNRITKRLPQAIVSMCHTCVYDWCEHVWASWWCMIVFLAFLAFIAE